MFFSPKPVGIGISCCSRLDVLPAQLKQPMKTSHFFTITQAGRFGSSRIKGMDIAWICLIVLIVAGLALLGVYLFVRRLLKKQKEKPNGEDLTVTLPLPKPAPDATDDGMDPTQLEGIDYSSRRKMKTSPNASDGKSLVVDGDKLLDPSREDGSASSLSSIKKKDEVAALPKEKENEVCSERSDRPVDNNPMSVADNNNNKDKKLLMFEAPPPYEESSKTASGTSRMVPMNMPQMDNTQMSNTSRSSTPGPGTALPINSAPQSANLPKRLIPVTLSPNKFAGPRGETAAPAQLQSSSAAETTVNYPPVAGLSPPAVTLTSMCRSEMDVGINGENAGRTPRANSPLTSGGSLGTTNASTVVTFTPGSSTNEKEENRYKH